MTDNPRTNTDEIPESVLEEAAVWQAHLRDTDQTSQEGRALRAEFSAWLLADPLHRKAYSEMEWLFGALDEPVANALAQPASKSPYAIANQPSAGTTAPRCRARAWSLPGIATAACLLLALTLGIGWQQEWPTRWQSDHITAVGEQATVALEDGSTLQMNTGTAVSVDYTAGERQITLHKGEAWFDVTPDADRPFTVDAGVGRVRVTGTRFNVQMEDGAAVISLDEGSVDLYPAHDQTQPMTLVPGQQARMTPQGVRSQGSFDRSLVTAWQRGQFVFYDRPLAEVVAKLNRHRAGRILIVDDELNNLRVSGVFSTRDPDAALDVITKTLPVEQVRLTDYLVLIR